MIYMYAVQILLTFKASNYDNYRNLHIITHEKVKNS